MFEKLFVPVIIRNCFSLENFIFSEKRKFFFWKVFEISFECKKLVILGNCKNFLGKFFFGVDLALLPFPIVITVPVQDEHVLLSLI